MCFVCVVYVNMLQNASLKEQPIAEQICISNYYDYDYDYDYAYNCDYERIVNVIRCQGDFFRLHNLLKIYNNN